MKIGIDCRAISDSAGIGAYARELVKHLLEIDRHNRYALFFSDDFSGAKEYERPNAKVRLLPSRKWRKFLPVIYSHYWVASAINREKTDVCLFPANAIPLGFKGKAVLTIHDLAVYKRPELFPDQLINFDRHVVVPRSLRRAEKIIAVSQNTKNDIVGLFKIPPEKISVVYEGVAEIAKMPAATPAKDYFLFLGTIEPRKNLKRLIEAFEKFVQEADWDGELALAGASGWKNREIFEAIGIANQELKREAVRHLGYVSEADKWRLLGGALAFVYPSLYEGFGLPVLEAMAAGAPVITSDNSSLPEIAGDAAILVDPLDAAALSGALKRLACDKNLRQELREKGRKKSQEFTWDNCATLTLSQLESAGKAGCLSD